MTNEKYDRQAAAWAIDRAIETLKSTNSPFTADQVTETAEKLCAWMFPKPDEREDADPTEADMLKQDAINHGESVQ